MQHLHTSHDVQKYRQIDFGINKERAERETAELVYIQLNLEG